MSVGCLMDVWRTSDGCLTDVWRTSEGRLTDIWRTFDGLLTDVWRISDRCMMAVLWMSNGCLLDVWWMSDEHLMNIWWIFEKLYSIGVLETILVPSEQCAKSASKSCHELAFSWSLRLIVARTCKAYFYIYLLLTKSTLDSSAQSFALSKVRTLVDDIYSVDSGYSHMRLHSVEILST